MSLQTEIAKARILKRRAEERHKAEAAKAYEARREMEAAQVVFYRLLREAGLCGVCEKPDCKDPAHVPMAYDWLLPHLPWDAEIENPSGYGKVTVYRDCHRTRRTGR